MSIKDHMDFAGLRDEKDHPVTRGREGGLLSNANDHHLDTCDAPICVETRRIIQARGRGQRTPQQWNRR